MKKTVSFAITIVLLSMIGCAAPGPIKHTVYNLVEKPSVISPTEKDDLIVRMAPITHSNYEQYPSVYCEIKYSTDPRRDRQLTSYGTRWIIAHMPIFEATITNNTGHVIRFNRAVIKLQDESGNTYDCLSKQDLTILNNNAVQYEANNKKRFFYDTSPIINRIATMRVIDNNLELLPNSTHKGYIMFNIPPHHSYDQYTKFMGSHQYFKVSLFEIPVETDQAGVVKKTANYEFYYDIVAETKLK